MAKIYHNATELVGNTPLMELGNIEKKLGLNVKILAKLEFFNPAGSVKDRVALRMLVSAKESGKLTKDSVIVEPTSGNTGIALASIASSQGYKAILVMPESMSKERKDLISAFGAELVLTPKELGMKGAISKAEEIVANNKNAILAGQFVNPANPLAHYETTGPEIFRDTDGNVDFFVSTVGTGGTISGTGKYLKENIPNIEVVAVEPEGSPVLSGGKAGSHGIQGIGAGFVPDVLDTNIYDIIERVSDEEAYEYGRLIGREEGLLVGISSGAALAGAIKVAKGLGTQRKTFVVVFPDTGSRYLSTPMFM